MPATENEAFEDESSTITRNRNQKNGFTPPSYEATDFASNGKDQKDDPLGVIPFKEQEPEPQPQTCGEAWRDYPKSVAFIFGNEFCERFSYYGMKAVLMLYMLNILKYDQTTSTALVSAFSVVCYFSPILGSILADGYIGKFPTIMSVSIFYAAGNVILAVAAWVGASVHPWLDFIGLLTIGICTGGIKPCVQPFGADQFRKGQERQLSQFFSIFYFAINAGSTISIFVTPLFRVMPCEGLKTCYPLAFGVPAVLMVVAVLFFALGSFWYKKLPPNGNVFSKISKVIGVAIRNRHTFEVKRDHWLDHYMDSHYCNYDDECREAGTCQKLLFVDDVKALFKILVVFVPLPIFWALYDQQSTTWVVQATQMNVKLSPGVNFLPDQMGVLNSVMIMILIPIFSLGVYPLCNKFVNVTPLRKMSVGCFLAAVAYLVCMGIQINIRPTLPTLPDSGQTIVNVSNYVQACKDIRFLANDGAGYVINQTLDKGETGMFYLTSKNLTWEFDQGNTDCDWVKAQKNNKPFMQLSPNMVGYAIVTDTITDMTLHTALTEKSQSGEAVYTINVNYYADAVRSPENLTVAFCKDNGGCDPENEEVYVEYKIKDRTSDYQDIKEYDWYIYIRESKTVFTPTNLTFNYDTLGGIFTLTLLPDMNDTTKFTMERLQQAPNSTYSILWQVPQYFVISVAEVLFSITGYELAYSQAPLSMKSVVFACYLLTTAVGDTIIMVISLAADFGADMTWMFLAYACLMFFIAVVFIYIAIKYKYSMYVRDDDKATQ